MPLVVVGAGGLGREVLDVIDALNANSLTFNLIGYVDDGSPDDTLLVRRGTKILGPISVLDGVDTQYVIAIGSGSIRQRLRSRLDTLSKSGARLVHPFTAIGGDCTFGQGTIVFAHVSIACNVIVGQHSQIHRNSTIGHDVKIEDCVTILPGAVVSGNVYIGRASTIGANSTILQGITIGATATVGAGAVVLHDVKPGETVVGVPAHPIVN